MDISKQIRFLQMGVAFVSGVIICLVAWFVRDIVTPPPTPSPEVMQTSIAQAVLQTQTAWATDTPIPPPTATNTPSASATPALGTMDNPYGFREVVTLTQGSATFTLQVIEIIRGEEANRVVRRANYFNDKPAESMEYAIIRMWLKMIDGSGKVELSGSDISSISNGQAFDYWAANVCCLKAAGYPDLDASLITVGAEAEGWVARPVFIADEHPMIAIGLDSSDSDITDALFLALTP